MAKIALLHSIHLSALLCSTLFFVLALSTERDGFSLELVPIKSDRSPFYKSNLTDSEIVKQLTQFDQRVKHEINLTNMGSLPIAFIVSQKYLVPFTIGTGPAKRTYGLIFDTGSSVTWTQCLPCRRCFDQSVPIYNTSQSSTFQTLRCDHPVCRPPVFNCIGAKCEYHRTFLNGIFHRGYLSTETVKVRNSLIPNVIFGCTFDSRMNFPSNMIHGIMSFDMSPTSFLMQTRGLSQGMFSYCLVPMQRTNSWLRFGTQIVHPQRYQTTPILRYPDNLYYVSVIDISINGYRLGLPPGTFDRRANGDGGFRLDTGYPTGSLILSAHARVAAYLEQYFRNFHVPIVNDRHRIFSPCVRLTVESQRLLPALALIFPNGAHYTIHPQKLFFADRESNSLCFTFRLSREESVLGAHEQANTWTKFDVNRNLWSFEPQNCAQQS